MLGLSVQLLASERLAFIWASDKALRDFAIQGIRVALLRSLSFAGISLVLFCKDGKPSSQLPSRKMRQVQRSECSPKMKNSRGNVLQPQNQTWYL